MRSPAAWQLAIALCVITSAVNLQAPYYAALAAHDGLGHTATTLAFATYVLGILPVLIMFGGLPERTGPRPLILAALCLCAAATALTWIAPGIISLAIARLVLGMAAALTSIAAPGWMLTIVGGRDSRQATTWVTASTSLGFGLGAALTSLCLLRAPSLAPPSLPGYLVAALLALLLVVCLAPQRHDSSTRSRLLRLPTFPPGSLPFSLAILLAWASVGLVIALFPATLEGHGLSAWSGFATLGICSGGVLFQPLARRMSAAAAVRLGLLILPLAYALLVWGALTASLLVMLAGALAASSACYGFIYLGGLSGVLDAADGQHSRASAGFFLMAYLGFSLPVVITGRLMDALGHGPALLIFGGVLLIATLLLRRRLAHRL